MNFDLKKLLLAGVVLAAVSFGGYKFYAASCCSATAATSGCTPSNCRGAKTKFGEARVISELRLDLIALKSEMEQSKTPTFDERSYDIHGIIGDSDDESLEIIINEIKLIEDAFAEKLEYKTNGFELPSNKAKQIDFISERINTLKQLI